MQLASHLGTPIQRPNEVADGERGFTESFRRIARDDGRIRLLDLTDLYGDRRRMRIESHDSTCVG